MIHKISGKNQSTPFKHPIKNNTQNTNIKDIAKYLSLPPTRHDLTQGQKPEGRLKWG